MGRSKGNKKAGGGKAAAQAAAESRDLMSELSDLFKPMPPNKRSELNTLVEKLMAMTSNYVADEPLTPIKLYQEFQEIYALVEKITALEEQFNMTRRLRAGSRQIHIQSFLEWLDKYGAKINNVQIHDYGAEQGYGLKVTEPLKVGEKVISIPRKCFMSTETARDSTLSTLMEKDPMLRSMPNVALALHLVLEKNSPASFWEPYINVLPHRYNTVLYFGVQDFQELKGSPALEDALKQFKYVARQYAYFYRKFQSTILRDYFTFDDYRWAVSTVMTRQNQVPVADLTHTTNTLVPFWDFSNHECRDDESSEISTDFVEEPVHATVCLANRDFVAGEEFTIFYGVRSNADFLVHNGFVSRTESVSPNPHDAFVLKMGVAKNDPLAAAKLDLLDRLSVPRQGTYFPLDLSDKPFDNVLLALVRILCLKSKEEIEPLTLGKNEKIENENSENKNTDEDKKNDSEKDCDDNKEDNGENIKNNDKDNKEQNSENKDEEEKKENQEKKSDEEDKKEEKEAAETNGEITKKEATEETSKKAAGDVFEDKVRDLLNDVWLDDPELDKKAFKYIETRCMLLLKSYPTSLEQDLDLLAKTLNDDVQAEAKEETTPTKATPTSAKLNANQINCVLLRTGEKKILKHVIQYCQNKHKLLIDSQ